MSHKVILKTSAVLGFVGIVVVLVDYTQIDLN